MAVVIITLTDNENEYGEPNGNIGATVDFEPPIAAGTDPDDVTPAQREALLLASLMQKRGEGLNLAEAVEELLDEEGEDA